MWRLAVLVIMVTGAGTPPNQDLVKVARMVRGVLSALLLCQLWTTVRRLWPLLKPKPIRAASPFAR